MSDTGEQFLTKVGFYAVYECRRPYSADHEIGTNHVYRLRGGPHNNSVVISEHDYEDMGRPHGVRVTVEVYAPYPNPQSPGPPKTEEAEGE